jgi:hypothetical protein
MTLPHHTPSITFEVVGNLLEKGVELLALLAARLPVAHHPQLRTSDNFL